MKKVLHIILIVALALFLVACDGTGSTVESEVTADTNAESTTRVADTNDNGDNDVQVTVDADANAEVVIEFDDVAEGAIEEAQEITAENIEAFCTPGETYTYASAEGNVDSEIIGLTTYKGGQMCEAKSQTTIESPIGEIVTDTTYYFDETYEEYWIITSVDTGMGAPSTTEIHLVNGEVQ